MNTIISIPIIKTPDKRVYTDDQLAEFMVAQLNHLVDLGALKGSIEDLTQDFDFDQQGGFIHVTVPFEAIGLSDQFNSVGSSYAPKYEVPTTMLVEPTLETVTETFKTFSVATITERMKIAMRNPKLRFRYMIIDYKRYFNSKKSKILEDPEMATKFRNLFLTDMMGMFTELLPLIEEGKQLSVLVGTNQVTPKLTKVARDLSRAYRFALKQEEKMGQIMKNRYAPLKQYYAEFMNILIDTVFPGLNEVIGGSQVEGNEDSVEMQKAASKTKKYSYCKDGRISLFSEEIPTDAEMEAEAKAEEKQALTEDKTDKEFESQKEYAQKVDPKKIYDCLKTAGFKEFTSRDWMQYNGCEKVNGKQPLIFKGGDNLDILFDANGLCISTNEGDINVDINDLELI